MELRWFVKKTTWEQYDDRTDTWYPKETSTEPKLQVLVDGKWQDVPTVIKVKPL